MSPKREESRRMDRRAFRPEVEGSKLETRKLLSTGRVAIAAKHVGPVKVSVAHRGQTAIIKDYDGEIYEAIMTGGGTIRAKPMKGGRVGFVISGTTNNSVIEFDPLTLASNGSNAHSTPPNVAKRDGILHVGQILVKNGTIGQILGYRTVELSGPITVVDATPVDRIAVASVVAGGSIQIGTLPTAVGASGSGDLDTLDIFGNADFSGAGVSIGRDLNWMNIGGNLTISNGAVFEVGRDFGLLPQPAKGTDPGGQGGLVEGDLTVDPTSVFQVDRFVDATLTVTGQVTGANRFDVNDISFLIALGGFVS